VFLSMNYARSTATQAKSGCSSRDRIGLNREQVVPLPCHNGLVTGCPVAWVAINADLATNFWDWLVDLARCSFSGEVYEMASSTID
jgi:hypothetical protein